MKPEWSGRTTGERWRRARIARSYDVADTTVVVDKTGTAHELTGATAQLARAMLTFCSSPRSRAEILAHVAEASGRDLSDADVRVMDELLALLAEKGALEAAVDLAPPTRRARRLVLGLTGAVASMHAPALVLCLQQRGFELRIAATETATRFVRCEALELLVHRPVVTDPFAADVPVPHLQLARWADVVLVWPASATTISRLATGDHGSLVSSIALSARVPVVVVPSMNAAMLESPATQRNLAQLVADGMHVIHPALGLEVADAPGERAPMRGPSPPPAVVAQLVETVLKVAESRRGCFAPVDASGWDALYASHAPEELPWHTTTLDADLAEAIAEERATTLLDIGTGTGIGAIAAARAGLRVVAIDVSQKALDVARAASEPIVWLEDDIRASRLRTTFDVLLDRGCLHLLSERSAIDYATNVARLCTPGGALILKTHATEHHGARPYSVGDLRALFGDAFDIELDKETELPGARPARTFVLRRRF